MMHSVTPRTKQRPWPLGPRLLKLRETAKLSIRDASTAAGFSTATWAALEKGYKSPGGGVRVDYTPRAENVVAAARVVGMDAQEALRLAGMDPSLAPVTSGGRTLSQREILHLWAQLAPGVRDAMLTLLRGLASKGDGEGEVPEMPSVGEVTTFESKRRSNDR